MVRLADYMAAGAALGCLRNSLNNLHVSTLVDGVHSRELTVDGGGVELVVKGGDEGGDVVVDKRT